MVGGYIINDRIIREQRSEVMRKIRSQSQLENIVAKELYRNGIRYRRNSRNLFGRPDISIKKYKLVIFIDSCFWHCCPIHGNIPKSNVDFWEKKLTRNAERDIEVNKYHSDIDWNIIRIWEHDIISNFDPTIDRVLSFINESKKSRDGGK